MKEKRVLNLNKMGAELYILTKDFRQCQEDIWKYHCTKYSKVEDEKSTGTKYLQTGWRRRTEHDDEGPQMPGQRVVPKKTTDWVAVGLGLLVVVVLVVGLGVVVVVGLGLLVVVVLVVGLGVVVVVGLKVVVVVGGVGVVVLVVDVDGPSSVQATNGSPVLPAAQKHSSPLSVT